MAALLQRKAAQSIKPSPSSFYSDKKKNPVIAAFEDECKLFIQFTRKKVSPGYKRKHDEACSRGPDMLFSLWNTYEARLPRMLYLTRVIEMGDFLVSVKEYNMALWQCYGRYLDQFGDRHIEDITDIETVKEIFFPGGMESEDASLTFRALYGKSICNYQVVLMTDPKLQNTQSVTRCLKILSFLRLITQVVLPREPLCWLVYNGTIHIYSVSRHLMTLGHSARVLEYLLWACMCMEASVPLMSVKYLLWRTTLYTAVCQCYYDTKAAHHAEMFARRALGKVNELSQLEKMSSAPASLELEAVFRQAAVKVGVMVYKRAVFETRKKPKGLLRPKTRSNLKDAQSPVDGHAPTVIIASDGRLVWRKTAKQRHDEVVKKFGNLPWPRTPAEKLLADMFEGSAAQFLAILETISDSTRRTLLTSLPAPESDDHILDVFSELFFAGVELISGGGGHTPRSPQQSSEASLFGVAQGRTLIDMATRGEDGVSLSSVVKFVKWAYNYEQWETFDALVEITLEHIKETGDPSHAGDQKALEIMLAMEPLNPNRKFKKAVSHVDESSQNEGVGGLPQPPTQASQRSAAAASHHDDMINLAELLYSCTREPDGVQVDRDMVVDAALFLWNKCKNTFQKFQTGAADSGKYLQRMENPGKWVHILSIVHEVMYWTDISLVDPAVTAEVALRLALVLENNVSSDSSERAQSGKAKGKPGPPVVDTGSVTGRMSADIDEQSVSSGMAKDSTGGKSPTKSITSEVGKAPTSVYSSTILQQNAKDQLLLARDILDRALQGISDARQAIALTDGKSIADVGWVKELNQDDQFADSEEKDRSTEKVMESADAVRNLSMDLHMELMFMYHRVCLKLVAMKPETGAQKAKKTKSGKEGVVDPGTYIESIEELANQCNKNLLYKSLFYCQKALMAYRDDATSNELQPILQEAMNLITKAQDQEYKLYTQNTEPLTARESGVPPAPLLLCRTDSSMVFKPAPFNPSQKVAWYRLFGRSASGSNVKVRLNDYFLQGTGDEVPAYDCQLAVSGLKPNERYVFAVAAYTEDGQMIGGSIGDTGKPILASHPLPVLMAWAFLSQAAYQTQCYAIAQTAGEVLWDHFVAPAPPPDLEIFKETAQKDFKLTLKRLNKDTVSVSSPVLLRMFLSSISINVDVSAREGALFSDKLCDQGPYYPGQMGRLGQSERMLVAIELAGWLNESNMALQAVVQCYGLLAPMLHFKIPSIPVLQVLMRCQAVLQEVPISLRIRRQVSINDSLHHMIATITYYLTKVLRTTWRQRALANNIIDGGKKMLKEAVKEKEGQSKEGGAMDNVDSLEGVPGTVGTGNVHTKKKRIRRPGQMTYNVEGPQNEELRALEAHMLKLSKMAQSSDELTGSEDPNLLHAYIAALPSRHAYKEVIKFKRRTRFLEFLVLVVQKALTESQVEVAIDWCEETMDWLHKRNETLSAVKATLSKQPGAVTVAGDDPKKFAAAVVEYNKNKPQEKSPEQKSPRKKKRKYYLLVNKSDVKLPDAERMKQEEKEERAVDVLDAILPDYWHTYHRRKRLRKICLDELPWRCQLNILQGLCHFALFLNKIELREKFLHGSATDIFRSSYLDHEWFTFETAGTLVVGWEGGPSRQATRGDYRPPTHSDLVVDPLQQMEFIESEKAGYSTAIDIAAAAAIGNAPPPIPPPPEDKDDDTPRTYRSDDSVEKGAKTATHAASEFESISVKTAMQELQKTFDFFQKAVVLAHRGRQWTLLQNACRSLWNCAHTALLRAFASSPGSGSGVVTTDQLRQIVWHPFYIAADCLLDMMVFLQNEEEKRAKKRKKPAVKVNTWMGSVVDEKGGASLKFEEPLDDITTIDARWIRRMVMRAIEILYYEQRWEKVAEIAMRFNVTTHDRYAQQVSPLLVQAQRKLISRVDAYGGPAPAQPHFKRASEQAGGIPITAHNYQDVTLRVEADPGNYKPIDPGGHIDPEGHDVYLGPADAYKLVCVPLDVTDSLTTLRDALDVSHYVARALQHSRKLMVLYLAGQQNTTSSPGHMSTHSHVEFAESDGNPQGPVPSDMMQDEFKTIADVQSSSLPKSQLGVVIESYDKTIEMLQARNYRGLASQAMHELGNIYYHSGNIRSAYKWWAEALDLILNTTDTIHTWRELLAKNTSDLDDSAKLLERCGLWGCVLAGTLTAKIAQYILTSDLGLRMESCFLSAVLFKALFRTTLPHPAADRDYALYEVGEGCEVQYLLPGIDLLSDRFRCDGRTLVACVRWVTEELSRGRHNLMVLPLLTLYQYFTTFVCRDLQRAVDGRILKVKILTDLGLFSEAITTLLRLLHGERLPQTSDSNFRQVESRMTSHQFNTSKPLLEPINLKILEMLLEKRLSPGLATLFGAHLTCHLSLVQSHLLTAIADTIAVMPEFEEEEETPPEPVRKMSTSTFKSNKPPPSITSKRTVPKTVDEALATDTAGSDDSTSVTEETIRVFTGGETPPTLERIKGTLLRSAEQSLTSLCETITDQGGGHLSASELELVVLCKLEIANITRQRHLSKASADIVISAMKLIQNAKVFEEHKESPTKRRPSSMRGARTRPERDVVAITQPNKSSQYQYQNFQSRSRLDARLWLDCRLALVKGLMGEIRGMGQIGGKSNEMDLPDSRQYCVEGLAEAEACGDIEIQAEFLLLGAMIDLHEGRSLDDIKQVLQDVVEMLRNLQTMSTVGQFILAVAIVQLTDLETLSASSYEKEKGEPISKQTLNNYGHAQNIILNQMMLFGEQIEHRAASQYYSSPNNPLRNIYLSHVVYLAKIKLRIGYTLARDAARLQAKYAKKSLGEKSADIWIECAAVLGTALELCNVAAIKEPSLEAEILLTLGKVQRQLYECGAYQARAVGSTLVQAINISYNANHDLGLIRQAYLELALLYLSSDAQTKPPTSESTADKEVASPSQKKTPSKVSRSSTKASLRSQKSDRDVMREKNRERNAAWLAIRAATTASVAQRTKSLMVGDPQLTSLKLTSKIRQLVPEFAVMDLVGGQTAKPIAPKPETHSKGLEPVQEGTQHSSDAESAQSEDDTVLKALKSGLDISWIHVLGYSSILQRLCNTTTLGIASDGYSLQNGGIVSLGTGFEFGYANPSGQDGGVNHDVIRLPLMCGGMALRQAMLHQFLAENLPQYASECCAIAPPSSLNLKWQGPATQLSIPVKKYEENVYMAPESVETETVPNIVKKTDAAVAAETLEKTVVGSSENEISIQWYQPAMEDSPDYDTNGVILVHATNKEEKKSKSSSSLVPSAIAGKMWLSLPQLIELHAKLAVVRQKAEISLAEQPKPPSQTPSSSKQPSRKTKRTTRITQLSAKVKKDENLEALLKQCISDIHTLLKSKQDSEKPIEIPFPVALINIYNVEQLFDPSYGDWMKNNAAVFKWISQILP